LLVEINWRKVNRDMPTKEELTPREKELVEVKEKIEALLTQHKAELVPVTLISGTRFASRVDIVPIESVEQENKQA